MDVKELEKNILQGDRRALAKAITLVESTRNDDRIAAKELLSALFHRTGKSLRVGISGSPGVGKSSFIEKFGAYVVNQGKKVAVLAIDPSSPITKGSIMGDKTRMETLSRLDNVFIRPSPSQGSLGGVARRTREAMLLCEAAGYDFILVETVGVGQSEIAVADMTDLFCLLQLPNAGDELQGIKKGILELANIIVITKADGPLKPLAEAAQLEHQRALHYLDGQAEWQPQVLLSSALENQGMKEIFGTMLSFKEQGDKSKTLMNKRQDQLASWFQAEVKHGFLDWLSNNEKIQSKKRLLESQVLNKSLTPQAAAHQLLSSFKPV